MRLFERAVWVGLVLLSICGDLVLGEDLMVECMDRVRTGYMVLSLGFLVTPGVRVLVMHVISRGGIVRAEEDVRC